MRRVSDIKRIKLFHLKRTRKLSLFANLSLGLFLLKNLASWLLTFLQDITMTPVRPSDTKFLGTGTSVQAQSC